MSLISELFSDIFAQQDNWLTRLDSRTKLLVALITLLCLMFSRNAVFPVLVIALTALSALSLQVPGRLIGLRLVAPLGVALLVLALQSVLTGTTPLFGTQFLGHTIVVTREGLHSGEVIASRVLASVSVLLLLSLGTPAHRIFHASRWLGMPKAWIEIALLMYRYIFVLLDLVADMTIAQRVRLGYSGLRRTWNSAGIVGGTVIVRSMDQAVRSHEAMRVRAYNGEVPFQRMPAMALRDWSTVTVTGLALLSTFWVTEVRLG
jgi:cobalt/nickel transport system permease protein